MKGDGIMTTHEKAVDYVMYFYNIDRERAITYYKDEIQAYESLLSMKYNYKYDKEYQTLQQWDEHGVLRSSMSMPKSDLNLIAQLNIKENILRNVDLELKTVV